MSKVLEDIRDSVSGLYINDKGVYSYIKGFDKAIALDLTIKFVEWKDKNFYQQSDENYYPYIGSIHFNIMELIQFQPQESIKLKELYQYWLENIYKTHC